MSLYRTKSELLRNLSETAFKSAKKLENNTWEYINDAGNRTIRLHDTDIMEFLPRNKVRLSSGGWLTMTTKQRLNNHLPRPLVISQDKRKWFIRGEGGKEIPFFDGMVVPLDGKIAPSKKIQAKIRGEETKQKRLDKLVENYCKALRKQLRETGLPMPSGGDCWFCCLRNEKGVSWGELSSDTEHLMSHLKEKYIMGSLIFNAMQHRGYKAEFWFGIDQDKKLEDYHIDTYVRAVRNYYRTKMGMVR